MCRKWCCWYSSPAKDRLASPVARKRVQDYFKRLSVAGMSFYRIADYDFVARPELLRREWKMLVIK
jgi:hypothetical protein